MPNTFYHISDNLPQEVFETLLDNRHVKIERIFSKGQTSPKSGWYNQDLHEWVTLLEGAATITFEDGKEANLSKGDYLNIPAHVKHKVSWTELPPIN